MQVCLRGPICHNFVHPSSVNDSHRSDTLWQLVQTCIKVFAFLNRYAQKYPSPEGGSNYVSEVDNCQKIFSNVKKSLVQPSQHAST